MCGSGLSAFSSRRMDVRVQANTKITTPAIMLDCYLYLFRFKSRMGSDSKTQRRGQREEISSPLQATYLTEPLSGGSFEFFTLVTPAVAISPPYSTPPPPRLLLHLFLCPTQHVLQLLREVLERAKEA